MTFFFCSNGLILLFFSFFFFLRPLHAACWILAPQPGFEPVPPASGVQNLSHWTASEVPMA